MTSFYSSSFLTLSVPLQNFFARPEENAALLF